MMLNNLKLVFLLALAAASGACQSKISNTAGAPGEAASQNQADGSITPVIITEKVKHDTDDPAIWVHPQDPSQSLIIGTDKEADGALYVFDLEGKIIENKVVRNLRRPNNVDVGYGLLLQGQPTDIAVATERLASTIRVFSLPDMKMIDKGGIPVFAGETDRAPMGIGLYTNPTDKTMYAIVGRKEGPREGYLWQYRLEDDGQGQVKATLVRKFGKWSGKKEIEAIAVDNELGYVYYADEMEGIRKYYAHPDSSGRELALFGTSGFARDHEGISIYRSSDSTGFLLVSDQQANQFRLFTREGKPGDPNDHELVRVVKTSTVGSDGSEVTHLPLNDRFPRGLFVAMSEGGVFHYYDWRDIIGQEVQ
jgi:3-phytase